MSFNNLPAISERNYLKPINFALVIKRDFREVEYTCQSISLPSLSIGPANQSAPKRTIPHPGDKLNYDPFSVRFLVDETMTNYQELLNWLIDESNEIKTENDVTLIIYNSSNIPSIKVRFLNAFPVSLDPIEFDVTQETSDPMQCSVTFYYTRFTFAE